MFGNSELLEEIVETTEDQEPDYCSNGETVEECVSLSIGDCIEEPLEVKYQSALSVESVTPEGSITTTAASVSSSLAAATTTSSATTTTGRQHKSSRASAAASHGQQQHGLNNGTGAGSGRTTSSSSSSSSMARSHLEQEKRMRREIANSNERRRMQSINAGFQSLRSLLPHHEGEKLSKAAILQQTAEYIYQLEQTKTQLLSQNLQLKRRVDQHEGGDVPSKKRKGESQGVVVSLPVHVSESADEGLGSMSPEPLSMITLSAEGHGSVATSNEVAELKRQLERERAAHAHLEKQLRLMQSQLFPERFREEQLVAYQPHEVIEHTNNVLPQELEEGMPGLQVVSVVSVPTVGSTQTVETSNADSNTPPLSPQACEIIVPSGAAGGAGSIVLDEAGKEVSVGELLQIDSQPSSPKVVSFQSVAVFASQIEEQSVAGSFSPSPGYAAAAGSSLPVTLASADFKPATPTAAQFIGQASPTRPFSPEPEVAVATVVQQQQQQQTATQQQQRLPSVLEAAIKAEPKVEVERLPSPSNPLDDGSPQARLFLAQSTSRQNLETIVEAIRHLEGDHLFSDEPAQDVPLALTNKPSASLNGKQQRLLHAEVNSFLQFHATPQPQGQQQQPAQQSAAASPLSTAAAVTAAATAPAAPAAVATQPQQSRTQQRPGVIVVKHS